MARWPRLRVSGGARDLVIATSALCTRLQSCDLDPMRRAAATRFRTTMTPTQPHRRRGGYDDPSSRPVSAAARSARASPTPTGSRPGPSTPLAHGSPAVDMRGLASAPPRKSKILHFSAAGARAAIAGHTYGVQLNSKARRVTSTAQRAVHRNGDTARSAAAWRWPETDTATQAAELAGCGSGRQCDMHRSGHP